MKFTLLRTLLLAAAIAPMLLCQSLCVLAASEAATSGFNFFTSRQYAKAFPKLKIARDENPSDPSLNFYFASCAYELGKRAEAIDGFNRFFVSSTGTNAFTAAAEKCYTGLRGSTHPYSCKYNTVLLRWSPQSSPVRVFITDGLELPAGFAGSLINSDTLARYRGYLKSSQFHRSLKASPGYSRGMYSSVTSGLAKWQFLTSSKILSFQIVNAPEYADVIVFWCPMMQQGRQGYTTYPESTGSSYPLSSVSGDPVVIQLVTSNSQQVLKDAAHEFGHVWGLQHSNNPGDIMNALGNSSGQVSSNDILTVQTLYELPPDIYLSSPKH